MRPWSKVAVAVAISVVATDRTIARDDGAPIQDGWKRTVPITEKPWGDAGQYVIWVERGWLQVRRETTNGQADWHVVLARASSPTQPIIKSPKEPPEGTSRFEVSYREGRYFVREDLNVLRALREPKPADQNTWPGIIISSEHFEKMRAFRGGSNLHPPLTFGAAVDSWFRYASGPRDDLFDCWLRLTPTILMKDSGHGVRVTDSGLRQTFAGSNWVLDDGELLVANRSSKAEAKLFDDVAVGELAPPLEAKTLNGTPIKLNDYRGKYVLLDFWATWCGPCLQDIPRLQEVYEEFGRDKRFVMISLSIDEKVGELRNFVETKKLPWIQTILETEGKVTQAYGIEAIPATFLISPDGKVIAKDIRGEKIKEAVRKALGDRMR